MKGKAGNIAAAILAGGKNSRMKGKNKAFLKINGISLIERNIKLLKKIFEEVIIVTNSPQDFKSYENDAAITEDIIKNAGPLGGIHSALLRTSKEALFFVACDMPFLHNGLIRKQLKHFRMKDCSAIVPKVGDFTEPLHSIYRKNLADDICRFIKRNGNCSIRSFLERIDVCYWDLENTPFHRKIFMNLNTEENVRAIQGLYYGRIKGEIKGLA